LKSHQNRRGQRPSDGDFSLKNAANEKFHEPGRFVLIVIGHAKKEYAVFSLTVVFRSSKNKLIEEKITFLFTLSVEKKDILTIPATVINKRPKIVRRKKEKTEKYREKL
jgi:hypothetical protein